MPDPTTRIPEAEIRAPAPDCRSFATRGLLPSAKSREALRAELGAPDEIESIPVRNRHVPEQTDTLSVYSYAGLSATFYVLPARDLLSSVAVRDRRWLRFSAPTIGDPVDRVRALLGPADETVTPAGADTLEYGCGSLEGGYDPVFIVLENDTVAEIRFSFYVD